MSTTPPDGSRPSRKLKVRTGCITCKIRKVKCDEEKPFSRKEMHQIWHNFRTICDYLDTEKAIASGIYGESSRSTTSTSYTDHRCCLSVASNVQ
ncbi:hypothetical protein KCU98_g17616, partial [Aureobasidium melanogenum]